MEKKKTTELKGEVDVLKSIYDEFFQTYHELMVHMDTVDEALNTENPRDNKDNKEPE